MSYGFLRHNLPEGGWMLIPWPIRDISFF